MAIKLACGACGKKYSAPDESASQLTRCRVCGGELGPCDPSQVPAVTQAISSVEFVRPSPKAQFALLWATSLVTAACLGAAATWAMVGRPAPARIIASPPGVVGAEVPTRNAEVRSLREDLKRAEDGRGELMRAIDNDSEGRRRREEQEKQKRIMYALAEDAVWKFAGKIESPRFLRGEYQIQAQADFWIVEGITLESRSTSEVARAYFWAVEIERAKPGQEVPYRARRMVWDLHAFDRDPDREFDWIDRGLVKIDDGQLYRKQNFGAVWP